MNYPEISVVIPTYNNGPEIERAVLSILKQDAFAGSEDRVEIIIINDGSADEYLRPLDEVASKYACVVLLHNKTQLGPAATRNYGIQQAKGSLISFLDADDEWPLSKISTLLPFLNDDSIDIAGGKVKYVIQDGLPDLLLQYEDEQQRLTHVHLGTLLLRKSVFDRGFYFDESLRFSEDMDWWLQLRENNLGIVITEETTLIYHIHGNNMSANKTSKELKLLEVLHKSLQRRKNKDHIQNVPQLKDFRVQRTDPLISIVLPLYNGSLFIKRALDSVFAQTYSNLEFVVVDDGSTDGGAELVANLYPSAKIIRQANGGVASARNAGIKVCAGDLIAFLDQDDEWMPSKLHEQWHFLKNNPYVAFVTCNQTFECYEGASLPTFFKKGSETEHRSFVPSALLIRKHAVIAIGGFDETLKLTSDMDIIRRLRNNGFDEGNINSVLLRKWYHESNASMDKQTSIKEMLGMLHKQRSGK